MTTLKQKLAAGDLCTAFAVGRVYHHNLVQMLGQSGLFDGFWIDCEHGSLSNKQVELAALAGRAAGLDSFVRIAPTDYAQVTRCLEAGTGGVMAAQIQSAEHAEQFVGWAKFAPRGSRGLNNGGADGGFGRTSPQDFVRQRNESVFVAIQIETLGALEECDEIAAIDGVDHLFVGPVDLSQSLGVTGQFLHEKCVEAVARVAAACERHGKSWGAVVVSPEHAKMMQDHGCRLLSFSNDVRVVNAGIDATRERFAELLNSREPTPE